jgi:hypothetical protein
VAQLNLRRNRATTFVARRCGCRICAVPVQWNYQQTRRVSLVRDSQRGLRDLFLIVLARVQGRYSHREGRRE